MDYENSLNVLVEQLGADVVLSDIVKYLREYEVKEIVEVLSRVYDFKIEELIGY